MEYTIERIEQELQDILYHVDCLRNSEKFYSEHISGIIRSAEQIAEYAEQADFTEDY